jgi:hypothetical protein
VGAVAQKETFWTSNSTAASELASLGNMNTVAEAAINPEAAEHRSDCQGNGAAAGQEQN